MNTKQHANRIDQNAEQIKELYHAVRKGENIDDKKQTLLAEMYFIWHSLDLNKHIEVTEDNAKTVIRQFEIISEVSALFIELNNLLIK